jgi:glycosyltransferase involved in cell wall biosynthesis
VTERVTVVVVNWNGAHLLAPCLDSLAAQTEPHRVLVVDNASTDGSAEVLARYPTVEVLKLDTNTGFAGGAQAGLEKCGTEFVAFLNNDATAEPDWLAGLLAPMAVDPGVVAKVLAEDLSFPAAVKMGAMIEPPLGLPDMPPVLQALAGLGREIKGIIEHDLYPCAPDVPLPIAKRTKTYLSSCSPVSIDMGSINMGAVR